MNKRGIGIRATLGVQSTLGCLIQSEQPQFRMVSLSSEQY